MKGPVELFKKKVNEDEAPTGARFPGKTWPQVYAIISASFAAVTIGTLYAWPSPAIPKLISPEYNITIEEASLLTVIPPITMLLSTPIFCFTLDRLGRKINLIILVLIAVVTWVMLALGKNINVFYAARAINGFADSCCFATLPVYIAESVTPKIRGLFGNALMVLMFLGQVVMNCVGYYMSLRMSGFVMLIFPGIFFVMFLAMPETPYFYVMKNDQENARKSLQKLRGIKDVDAELSQITADVHRQLSESSRFVDLWTIDSNRKAVFIANFARGMQQFGGITALIVYCQYIFDLAGGDVSSGVAAIIFSAMLAVANIFGNVISDYLGRRKSMVISCFGCFLALLSEAIYFYLQKNTDVDLSSVTWFPLFGLTVYIIAFVTGLGVVPMLLLGELFSTAIRSKAAITTNVTFAIYIIIINNLFSYLVTNFGLWVPYLFFSVCLFFSTIASYYTIPDTKGKTLEEIQQMLKGNSNDKNKI